MSVATFGPSTKSCRYAKHDQRGEQRHLHGEDDLRRPRRCRAGRCDASGAPVSDHGDKRAPADRPPALAERRASPSLAARPSAVRIAGTAMNVSATVPPTQTVAPSTCRTTRVISTQCGTWHENRRGGARRLEPQARRGRAAVRGRAEPLPRRRGRRARAGPRARPRLRRRAGTRSGSPSRAGRSRASTSRTSRSRTRASLAAERGVEVEWLVADLAGMGTARPRVRPRRGALSPAAGARSSARSCGAPLRRCAGGGTILVVGHHSDEPRARLGWAEGPARPLHAGGGCRRRSTASRSRRPRRASPGRGRA